MADTFTINLRQGIPYTATFKIPGAVAQYPAGAVVHGQIRARPGAPLAFDLTPWMTLTVVGADRHVRLALTGAQTRTITASGYYDIVISATGDPTYATAWPVSAGPVIVEAAVSVPS